jgi:tRNA-dihydrouridine synthase B
MAMMSSDAQQGDLQHVARPRTLRIGRLSIDPPVLLAPMAGWTNWAFRALVRRLGGVGLLATEMVSARGLLEMDRRDTGEPARLWGVRDEPRPLAVQIWDNDPDTLAEVARRVVRDYGASAVDLNFGCPARDVAEKAESGSYLLGDPDRIGRIVARVVGACGDVPVTAKIRLGPDDDRITAGDVAQAVEDAGGAALAVHGRTAAQGYRGAADWDRIAAVKPRLRRIPLVGNGDLKTPGQVLDAFACWPVDGVMIGRAALARPWLFSQVAAALAGRPIPPEPTAAEDGRLLLAYLEWATLQFGPHKGVVHARAMACWRAARPGVRRFRAEIAGATTAEEFTEIVLRAFGGNPDPRP